MCQVDERSEREALWSRWNWKLFEGFMIMTMGGEKEMVREEEEEHGTGRGKGLGEEGHRLLNQNQD